MKKYFLKGVFDLDCEENGQQELLGEELGSSGNSGFNIDHLL